MKTSKKEPTVKELYTALGPTIKDLYAKFNSTLCSYFGCQEVSYYEGAYTECGGKRTMGHHITVTIPGARPLTKEDVDFVVKAVNTYIDSRFVRVTTEVHEAGVVYCNGPQPAHTDVTIEFEKPEESK